MTRELGGSAKGDEGRHQQPEQSFHEEEEKAPETESLDPFSYGHCSEYRADLEDGLQEIP